MGYLLIAISTHFPLRSELVLGQYRLRKEKQFLCRRQEVPCQGMLCFHWAQPTYSMAHSEGTEVLFSFGSPGICSPHYLVKLTPLTQSQSQAEAPAHFFPVLSANSKWIWNPSKMVKWKVSLKSPFSSIFWYVAFPPLTIPCHHFYPGCPCQVGKWTEKGIDGSTCYPFQKHLYFKRKW